MALNKKMDDDYGNDGISYWKIIETNINWKNKSSHVTLAGYISSDTRYADKQPMKSISFDWAGDDFPFSLDVLNQEDENVIHIAYEKIKESKIVDGVETNFFADAENV